MSEPATTIDATTGKVIQPTIIQNIEADAETAVAKVEDAVRAVEVDLGIAAVPIAAAPPVVPAVATSASVVTKVGELLALAGRTPVAYAEIADLAIASVGTDTDVVLAKIKDLLAYSGSKVDVWDQVVAVAKATNT